MNNTSILFNLRYFSLILVILFLSWIIYALPVNAQEPVNGGCIGGGTPGLGGPNIPDINSDGCVNEVDLSILLHCWGATLAVPRDCAVAAVPLFNVGISPNPDNVFQGQNRAYTVRADGGTGVPAGIVTFSVTQCPAGATCTLAQTTCNMAAAGECTVTLNLSNTGSLALGPYQVGVRGDHAGGFSSNATLNLTITDQANIFVTSVRYSGDLVEEASNKFGCTEVYNNYGYFLNLFSGHCLCTRLAQSSPMYDNGLKPGEYHAWLSHPSFQNPNSCGNVTNGWFSANRNVISSVNTGQVLVNTNGQTVVNELTDLWSGSGLQNPINYNERGTQVTGLTEQLLVWTGTNSVGECFPGSANNSCLRWTDNSSTPTARYGSLDRTNASQWTEIGTSQCRSGSFLPSANKRLYCIWFDDSIPDNWGIEP